MDFVLTDHLRERDPELGRAHCAGKRDHHFATLVEVVAVGVGGVFDHSGVEVAIMPIDEFADGPRFYAVNVRGFTCPLWLHRKAIT